MGVRKCGAFLGPLGIVFLLTACGDLGMVVPSQSYRVNAQVVNKVKKVNKNDSGLETYTLDTYSVVNSKSEIRPYFVNSVADDPDIAGFKVFVQSISGDTVSREVSYLVVKETPKSTVVPAVPQTLPEEPRKETPQEIPGAAPPPEDGSAGSPDEVFPGESPEPELPLPDGTNGDAVETEAVDFLEVPDLFFAAEPEAPPELPWVEPEFEDPAAAVTEDFPVDDAAWPVTGGAFADAFSAIGDDAADEPAVSGFAGAGPAETEAGFAETGDDAAGLDGTETGGAETAEAGTAGAETAAGPVDAEAGHEAETAAAYETAGTARAAGEGVAAKPVAADTAAPEEKPVPEEKPKEFKLTDTYLPAFTITEDLEIGRYNLVFQVLGENEILYRTFKPIYFLGDAEFTLEDIQSFLPVAVTSGKLIPPNIKIMLGTEVSASPELDPYVIWYSGKKILARGRVSGGANHLLWETPDRTGFYSIRAEVFPLRPEHEVPGNMIGKIKELSLPVSQKSEGAPLFDEPPDKFIHWYQFWGNLDDKNTNSPLVPLQSQPPRWIPYAGMYSLLVGRDDSYALPGMPFTLYQDEQGTGRIALHMAALADGTVFNISFSGGKILPPPAQAAEDDARKAADNSGGKAVLELFIVKNALTLRVASDDSSVEKSLRLTSAELNAFVTLTIDFSIVPERFEAELVLEKSTRKAGPISVKLAKPLSGEATVHFGGVERTVANKAGKYEDGTFALNEMALSYVHASMLTEEPLESGAQKSLIAEEGEPGAELELPALSAL
jgi:hypothetical protein